MAPILARVTTGCAKKLSYLYKICQRKDKQTDTLMTILRNHTEGEVDEVITLIIMHRIFWLFLNVMCIHTC